ncbi:MAG: aminomethyl transferase family protein [Phycisphaerales bacterium]|nr:aminomethyl transferase family protein [Phycisphaerales bacterium]
MARVSPLRRMHQLAEAAILPYAPPDAPPDRVVEVVASYGEPELEYAAIRRGCVLIDQPYRGLLEIAGPDRLDFLNRMVTQELKGFEPFQVRRSFWLNRKGRIDADLRLIELGGRLLADVDIHAAQRAITGLSAFIITEDVAIRDLSEDHHRLALHGPTALDLLAAITTPAEDAGPLTAIRDLAPDRATRVMFDGAAITVFRDDLTGDPGVEIIAPLTAAEPLFQRLIEVGAQHDHDPSDAASRYRLRPAGWHAINIARIEAGRPLYNIDFGPDSLPAETGVITDRVSFTKGCYLGQEIVARMHARGHPKRRLVALRLESPRTPDDVEASQPQTGAAVLPPGDPETDAVGAVTSSAISPMLGSALVAFAQVKYEHSNPGTAVVVRTEGGLIPGIIQPSLQFWKRV